MESANTLHPRAVGRLVGWSLIGTIVIGIVAARFVAPDININLSADVAAVAESMLGAEQRLRARAYLLALTFGVEALISVGFFFLLRRSGPILAGWSLFVGLAASLLMLLGAVFALNAAEFAGDAAYGAMSEEIRLMLASVQATSDYTSFHLGLILSSLAKAGFFALFLRSNLIPKIIAGWGLFASLFVAVTIVARDFIPVLGHGTITTAFMLSNLIALVSTGLYLGIRGVRTG
ncbi:MAG: DUF4386 domain-containing protein [Pseudomonadota bacterium]